MKECEQGVIRKLVRFGPTISFGLMGGVLGVCGFQFWKHWQFWVLDVAAWLCIFSGYQCGKAEGKRGGRRS